MAWSPVTGSGGHAEHASSPFTVTLGAACVVDDRVIVTASPNAGTPVEAITGITGTFCGTFTKDVESANTIVGGLDCRNSIWSAPVTSNGTPVLTITWVGGACSASAAAYRGLDNSVGAGAVDATGTSTNTGGNTNWSATTSGSTTAANELIIGGYADDGEGETPTAGSGFTIDAANNGSSISVTALESKDSGASGSTKTADGSTGSNSGWVVCVAVYKLSGGAPPSFTPVFRKTLSGIGTKIGSRQVHGW